MRFRTPPAPRLALPLIACVLAPVCACSAPLSTETAADALEVEPVSAEEVRREVKKLPPLLREQFETEAGRREFLRAMTNKRLLVLEARRRKLDEEPDIRRQVDELEERLVVQALLAAEEKARPYVDDDLRAFYEEHKESFRQPGRVRVARVLASLPRGAPQAERERARRRAAAMAARLQRGEPLEDVAKASDGPERVRGGDLGFLAPGDLKDRALERAAFRLSAISEVSPVVECADGFAVLRLLDRRPERIPPFAEVRGDVETRFLARHRRRVFDEVIEGLRKQAAGVDVGEQRIQ